MFYRSTRGDLEKITASKAILRGIAEDGGLYVPIEIPKIESNSLKELMNKNYREIAFWVMKKFFTDFTDEELLYCVESAYDEKFDTPEIAPLRKVGENYFLELYHGPTLAFKDMALSILPYLLKTAMKKEKIDKEIVILTATSGDTGKAALEGFSDVEGIKIIVFFPEDGVSEVQRRQMTTHRGNNTHVIAIKGNFDDAQNGVKLMFNDKIFNEHLERSGYVFSSANSINIGRLIPQVAYYFYAYSQLNKIGAIETGEKINVSVPTGNFGNILAAYYAKEMGFPINKLICASNSNNVLFDFMDKGIYDKKREFYITNSPSMDILISSNLERLLYSICDEKTDVVKGFMEELNSIGEYTISEDMKKGLNSFYGNYADEDETINEIKKLYEGTQYLMDTHTSVAYVTYNKYRTDNKDNTKTVIVSTASPYKFTGAVMNALSNEYKEYDDFELINKMEKITGIDIPNAIKDIDKREVIHNTVCSKEEMRDTVTEILGI